MKVWILLKWGDVDGSDEIAGVFAASEAAEAAREAAMVRIKGMKPRDTHSVEEWEVKT